MSFVTGFEIVDPAAFTQPPVPKKKRASKPKVRSGCVTCKSRKLKCDEGRPGCKRCAGIGVPCGGYQSNALGRQGPSTEVIARKRDPNVPIIDFDRFPMPSIYKDENEFQYFRFFGESTGMQLWLNFTPALWKPILEQACDVEPALRQLIIAVGALGKVSAEEGPNSPHLVFARKQYAKALQSFQEFIVKSGPGGTSTRIIIFAALMIFCFEAQHGDFDAAIKNVRSALGVLREEFAVRNLKYQSLKMPCPVPEAEYEMLSTLVRLDQGTVGHTTEVDNVNEQPVNHATYLDFSYIKEDFEIPPFRDLADARSYLSLVESRTIKRVNEFMAEQEDSFSQSYCPRLSKEIFDLISLDLRHWATSFAPVWTATCADYNSKAFLYASFIRIQALGSDLTIRGMHHTASGLKTKSVNKLSQYIVDLGGRIIENPRFHKNFTCETGVLAPLCSVVFTCRDMFIRKQALELIRATVPRREGVWDSIETLKTCEGILEMQSDAPFLVFRSLDAFAIRFAIPSRGETPPSDASPGTVSSTSTEWESADRREMAIRSPRVMSDT